MSTQGPQSPSSELVNPCGARGTVEKALEQVSLCRQCLDGNKQETEDQKRGGREGKEVKKRVRGARASSICIYRSVYTLGSSLDVKG